MSELEDLSAEITYFVVLPLCPLVGSPDDFSHTAEHIERARGSTDDWIAAGGLTQREIPHELRPHDH